MSDPLIPPRIPLCASSCRPLRPSFGGRSTKTKLTPSVGKRKVAKRRRARARKGKRISDLVENLADQLDAQKGDEPNVVAEPGIAKWFGSLADILAPEDFEEDSRGGAELRKTEVYERLQKAKRKRA